MGLPTAKEIIDRYDTSKKSSLDARASASKTMIKASNAEKGKLENIQDMIYYLETLIGAIKNTMKENPTLEMNGYVLKTGELFSYMTPLYEICSASELNTLLPILIVYFIKSRRPDNGSLFWQCVTNSITAESDEWDIVMHANEELLKRFFVYSKIEYLVGSIVYKNIDLLPFNITTTYKRLSYSETNFQHSFKYTVDDDVLGDLSLYTVEFNPLKDEIAEEENILCNKTSKDITCDKPTCNKTLKDITCDKPTCNKTLKDITCDKPACCEMAKTASCDDKRVTYEIKSADTEKKNESFNINQNCNT